VQRRYISIVLARVAQPCVLCASRIPADAPAEPDAGPPYSHRVASTTARALLEQAGFKAVREQGGFADLYALVAER